MRRSDRRRAALIGIPALIVGLIAFNTALAILMNGPRLDLTEERIYTLSPGVRTLVRGLDERVSLDFYWSREVGEQAPPLRAYAQRVREFLEELILASNGKLKLKIIDPEPYSEAEDAARAAGLASLQVDGVGRTLTLGLVVRGPTDRQEVMAYLQPEQESLLEYEVARAIAGVGKSHRAVIGLLSSIPTDEHVDPRNPTRPLPAGVIFQQIEKLYEVKRIDPAGDTLPPGLDLLMLVQPRGLKEPLLRQIDSFALSGKPLLIFADPWCESDPEARSNPMGGKATGTSADLGPLLAAWGIQIPKENVVGDRTFASRVRVRTPGGQLAEIDYLPFLGLRDAALTRADPIIGSAKQVNLFSVGAIGGTEGATTAIEPLIQSSAESQLIQTLKLGFFGEPDRLVRDFKSDDTRRILMARVTGPARSAFPEPAAAEGAAPAPAPAAGHVNIVIAADADMLDDQAWVVEDRLGNISLGHRAVADNGAVVLNAIEVLTGDRSLADLRGRPQSRRPFDRVQNMRKDAEARYLSREQDLQKEIHDTEMKIAQLQREKGGGNEIILSAEQQKELDRLKGVMAGARKELRVVQHDLQSEIEKTGRWLMAVNVIVWPLVVAAMATAWTLMRGFGVRVSARARQR